MNEIVKAPMVKSYPTLVKMEDLLSTTVPTQMCAKRLVRLFYVEISKNPDLNECTIESICGAIMSCAQYGLEPGIAGMLYLTYRYDKRSDSRKMAVMIGYRGMIEMAYRTGLISTIRANMVYERDYFKMQDGSECKIEHERAIGNRGRKIGAYAIVTMKDGSQHFDFMEISEIEVVRAMSSSPNKGPWVNDYDAMAKKTVIRRLLKYAPTSVNLSSMISFDEAGEYNGQNLETVGKAAIIEAGIDKNVVDMKPTQADSLLNKLSSVGK